MGAGSGLDVRGVAGRCGACPLVWTRRCLQCLVDGSFRMGIVVLEVCLWTFVLTVVDRIVTRNRIQGRFCVQHLLDSHRKTPLY